jgi:hypothetical protein
MLSSFFRSSSEVIQIREDDVKKIMENISHGPLKRSTGIVESKRHDAIREGTLRGCERICLLICWVDLDLIVAREPIHKG